MAIKEIQIKPISELPSHQKDALKDRIGEEPFNRLSIANALVEIKVANSIPHIDSINPINGTYTQQILNNINNGKKIEDIFN